FFQAEDGIRYFHVTGVQTCALPILLARVRAGERRLLVAGSTWPPDDTLLIRALAPAMRDGRLRVVFAPHEPSADGVAALERRLDDAAIRHTRLVVLESGAGDGVQAIFVARVDELSVM